ncbi:MAG: LuxR family transcriptional regulator [Anaerolineaceae bacterium]|nr:LuxR family transcriptional regulator [Anaerolineaceae bacterium]
MSGSLLQTKLYTPPKRPHLVPRPRLIEQLNQGLHLGHKLSLISAPAGFGKTTLVSEWLQTEQKAATPIAWLSLDEADNDPTRFLAYFISAWQTMAQNLGKDVLATLQTPQPPPIEAILTNLLNEIAAVPDKLILVLDDYHLIEANPIDQMVAFLLQHLPPQKHLVITTREDPNLPLARYRARSQLTELRAADLRFTLAEAAVFLNQVMGLQLSSQDVDALETRTEGWIAGLQLAALAIQGHATLQDNQDSAGFIKSFTGSHRFVMDYLVEEVLHQLPEHIQTFLLRTSILERMCGPLCEAVVGRESQEILEYLEQANLFIVPLDDERRWYRYHHLFADLLRQRLEQGGDSDKLHKRASQWFEDNNLEIEAFHHATAANDIERAERLIEGKGMPLHFRGAVRPVLKWLSSLPKTVLDAWPSLWTSYASVLLVTGQGAGVEKTLQAAEAALRDARPDDKTRDLIGRIAAIRATAAANRNEVDTIISQSHRALEYLHPDNLAFRTSTAWKLGFAYQLQGDRAAARKAYNEVIAIGQASGNTVFTLLATIGLGHLQEVDNQLHQAAETYRRVLQQLGERPLPFACEAHLGLARVNYEWNDLAAAQQHAEQSIELARQVENNDRFIASETFLARVKLAEGGVAEATTILTKAEQTARQYNFEQQLGEVTAVQILTLLQQGNLTEAAKLAQEQNLPLSQARLHLAQDEPDKALALLEPVYKQAEARKWRDKQLKVMVLQAVAHQTLGETEQARQRLGEALAMAQPGGFVRLFVDEGRPLAQLLAEAAAHQIMPNYVAKLLAEFPDDKQSDNTLSSTQPLIEPLSERELEVLQLVAEGLTNREIGEQLFLALDTVKGHNRRIFAKLQVQRRTEAVARARELGLLSL